MFKLINKNSKYNFLGMKKITLLFSSQSETNTVHWTLVRVPGKMEQMLP